MRIAVSITTHNRYDTFKKTYEEISRLLPENADLFIVDDGSEIPVKEATFRFDTSQGIAAAKNKCFELADGYDYHFAFDDDCFPIKKDWHLEYINTGLNHLCFSFDKFSNGRANGRIVIKRDEKFNYFKEPCGCMNFYTKKCFDVVGGMDEGFGKWSYEHVSHSMRIFNAGLTPYPFIDLKHSLDIFYSYDQDQTVERSVDPLLRQKLALVNLQKYNKEKTSKEYIPYKKENNAVITCFFTKIKDPQRLGSWKADYALLEPLISSALANRCKLIVLHDCFDNVASSQDLEFVKVETSINPYFQRWVSYQDYLKENKFDNVFLVDASDVEVLQYPFKHIDKDRLYCGWENETVGCQWMRKHHPSEISQMFINKFENDKLFNAGVVGGSYEIVMNFLSAITTISMVCEEDKTDMPAFNITASHFNGHVITGKSVTTEFKKFEHNDISLFRHK